MEVIIESVNITENTQIVKSVSWSYGEVSGNKQLEEPNPDKFIEFEKLNKDIVTEWLKDSIDFSLYDVIITDEKEEIEEKIISVSLDK